jgi:hypothetical protein
MAEFMLLRRETHGVIQRRRRITIDLIKMCVESELQS